MSRARRYASFAPAVAGVLALAACASPSVPEPESVAQKEAEASARAAEETPPPVPAGPEPVRDKIVVLEEGGAPARPSLGEAAATARAARAEAEPQGAPRRITNDNLAEVARDGRVSFAGPDAGAPLAEGTDPAEPPDPAAAPAPAASPGEPSAPAEVRDETYWRRRARDLRAEWRETLDEIGTLRERTADLRWRFYAEDDPWVRDSRIKPEWDDALERLRRAETAAGGFRDRVDALLEEGHRAGALPGWLREGIELEPAEEETGEERDPAEPIDPVIVDETGEGSR